MSENPFEPRPWPEPQAELANARIDALQREVAHALAFLASISSTTITDRSNHFERLLATFKQADVWVTRKLDGDE